MCSAIISITEHRTDVTRGVASLHSSSRHSPYLYSEIPVRCIGQADLGKQALPYLVVLVLLPLKRDASEAHYVSWLPTASLQMNITAPHRVQDQCRVRPFLLQWVGIQRRFGLMSFKDRKLSLNCVHS